MKRNRRMNAETRLDELLSRWQGEMARGQDLPATELCRECPELQPEVEHRLQALRQMQALAEAQDEAATVLPASAAASETATVSPPDASGAPTAPAVQVIAG